MRANGISEDLEKLIKIDSQFLVLVIFKNRKFKCSYCTIVLNLKGATSLNPMVFIVSET
jgi:hypothetical protein